MNYYLLRSKLLGGIVATALLPSASAQKKPTEPIAGENVVFEESGGLVAVEAEHFFKQTESDTRAWYLTTAGKGAELEPDGDGKHVKGASRGAYLEALPDSRRTHDDKLVSGENFSDEPGKMAVLFYKVHINTTGRFFVWARTHSTGTEDNGLHVGIDGEWPESGRRMQWTAKNKWYWDSKQRTQKVHTGIPGQLYLDIGKAGEHTIAFSMREDGFEFDRWLMTTDKDFKRPEGVGAASKIRSGKLPEPFDVPDDIPTLALVEPRHPDGDGTVAITGELKQWHGVTLTLAGPFAHEKDTAPNPFTDYRFEVVFTHETGANSPALVVPGYGNAGETSAESGNKWRAHFSPHLPGQWSSRATKLVQTSGPKGGSNMSISIICGSPGRTRIS